MAPMRLAGGFLRFKTLGFTGCERGNALLPALFASVKKKKDINRYLKPLDSSIRSLLSPIFCLLSFLKS